MDEAASAQERAGGAGRGDDGASARATTLVLDVFPERATLDAFHHADPRHLRFANEAGPSTLSAS